MKKLLIIPFIFLYTFGICQHCYYDVNKVDKFTHILKRETQVKLTNNGGGFRIYISPAKWDSACFLRLFFHENGLDAVVVGTSDPMMFLLNNDSTIKIYPEEITSGDMNSDYYGSSISASVTNLNAIYDLTEDQAKILTINTIKSVRIYFSDSYVEKSISKNHASNFVNAARCVFMNYNMIAKE